MPTRPHSAALCRSGRRWVWICCDVSTRIFLFLIIFEVCERLFVFKSYVGRFSWTAVLHQLVSAGAFVNWPDINGIVPLHLSNDASTALLLVLHGARPDRTDCSGKSCLDLLEPRLMAHGSLDGNGEGGLRAARAKLVTGFRKNAEFYQRRLATALVGDGISDDAPEWMADGKSEFCSLCRDAFSVLVRRHHCRNCGLLVCKQCSLHTGVTPRGASLRICDSCFNILSLAHAKVLTLSNDVIRPPE
jgi:hypothetical protein